ncbi:MAG: TIGR01620 family protein [Pseudomonadota bacterium]
MTNNRRRGPLIIDLEETALPEAPTPSEAPPVPDPGAAPEAMRAMASFGSRRRRSMIGRLAWAAAGLLLTIALGLMAERFVTSLFAQSGILGWIALGCLGVLILAAVIGVGRELAALARLGRIERVRSTAANALDGDSAAARQTLAALNGLYAGRPDLELSLTELKEAEGDTPDPKDRLALAEQTLMTPLDRSAEGAVARASRDVAAATALIPMAVLDIALVLYRNVRMVRRIAEIYGGRAGWFGSLRLLRAVATHMIATGAVAATDDLLGPLVGGGVLGTVSRRAGEAALNAALTARVGAAAIEVCRPLPFSSRAAPKAGSLVMGALRGFGGAPTA